MHEEIEDKAGSEARDSLILIQDPQSGMSNNLLLKQFSNKKINN